MILGGWGWGQVGEYARERDNLIDKIGKGMAKVEAGQAYQKVAHYPKQSTPNPEAFSLDWAHMKDATPKPQIFLNLVPIPHLLDVDSKLQNHQPSRRHP